MTNKVSFWLGLVVGAIVAFVAVDSVEEVESNGDKLAKNLPEKHPSPQE